MFYEALIQNSKYILKEYAKNEEIPFYFHELIWA